MIYYIIIIIIRLFVISLINNVFTTTVATMYGGLERICMCVCVCVMCLDVARIFSNEIT